MDEPFKSYGRNFIWPKRGLLTKRVTPQLRALIDAAYDAYRGGDDITGAHIIQDFEEQILAAAKPRIT
ncbi:MAG: hypothetical protein NVV62_03515 [Terricaulis sp.]|nr:hypothetical protein [Terricaulis sp.]